MRLIATSDSIEERRQFRKAAIEVGLTCDAGDCVGVNELAHRLSRAPADVAITSLGIDVSTTLGTVHQASAAGIPTYAVCDPGDESYLPKLLRAGALGYLRRVTLDADLRDIVSELQKGLVHTALGQLVAVVGSHSGVGTTTVATNLAFALASRLPGQVALAQLVDGAPDLAANLSLRPEDSMASLASGWPWLDSIGLARRLIRYPRGPAVLADQPRATFAVQWTTVGLRHLLKLLRSQFAFAVADFGQVHDPARWEALRLAEVVHVVLRLDAPAVESAKSLVASLTKHGVSRDKIVAIVSRHGQRGELPWPRVRAVLGVKVGGWIPDDPESVNHSLNVHRPLITNNRNVPIAASFARLAAACRPRQRVAA